ncbi:5-formyltetrahydrofolate cyclo-ligase [Lactobacillus sp. W8092]|nr:5-formyltetrahydrofolate cyclo-ligase [Lactobacillus sp. W8092]
MLTKPQMRAQQTARIANQIQQKPEQIAQLETRLLQLPQFQQAQTVAITYSMAQEIPTHKIIQTAQQQKKHVFLPQTLPHHQMLFRQINETTQWQRSNFGVWEPQTGPILTQGADLTVVPCLAVAADSHKRLGFGGGFYDRYLAQVKTYSVVLVLPVMLFATATWPEAAYDYPITEIISNTKEINA